MLGGLLVVVAVCLAASLATVGSAGNTATRVRLAFFNPVAANAFTASVYSGVKQQARALNASVTAFDAGFDQNKQVSQMEDAIVSKKFDAFIVLPVNGAVLVPPTEEAIEAGIKVVAVFNGIGPDLDSIKPQVKGMSSVVGQRLSINGRLLGNLIVSACAGLDPCQAAYMPGSFKQGTEKIRLDALKAAVGKHKNIKLIASAEGGYLADPAFKASTDVLQANADIDVFATSGDQMMTGIIQAVKNAGRSGQIKLIGNGTTIEGVNWVRRGIVFADPVAIPYTEGLTGTRLAIRAARGQKVPASVDELKLSPIGPVATKKTLSTPAGRKFKGEYHG
jgi:ribose transport system substrate-binding protein